jgi:aldo/keto reductase family protein
MPFRQSVHTLEPDAGRVTWMPPTRPRPVRDTDAVIARAHFGRTAHDSSRAIFGAAALAQVTQADADRALELLLAHGVNHIDTAASYGDSELFEGSNPSG